MVGHVAEANRRATDGVTGPSSATVPALDGVRAVAVAAVLLTHVGFQTGRTAQGQIGAVLARLDIGVTLFFLLSGFLLYRPFAGAHLALAPPPRLRAFWRNRALRILPAYWLLVAVVVPALSWSQTTPDELWRQALLLQSLQPDHLLAGLTQTWSLVVEAGFYVVLPGLAALARPRGRRTADQQLRAEGTLLGAMLLTALGWQVAVHALGVGDQRVTGLWLPGYLDWFALGMGLAVLRAWREATGRRGLDATAAAAGTWFVLGGLLFWLATTPLAGPRGLEPSTAWESLGKHLLYGLAATCLLVPLVLAPPARRSWLDRALSTRSARHLGRVSYGVFLWHLFALDLVFRLPGLAPFEGHGLVVTALAVPLSLLLAEASLRLVEEPALRRKIPAVAGRPQPSEAPRAAAGPVES